MATGKGSFDGGLVHGHRRTSGTNSSHYLETLKNRRLIGAFDFSVLSPTGCWVGMGKLKTLRLRERGSHWHDSAPRVALWVPPPPGAMLPSADQPAAAAALPLSCDARCALLVLLVLIRAAARAGCRSLIGTAAALHLFWLAAARAVLLLSCSA